MAIAAAASTTAPPPVSAAAASASPVSSLLGVDLGGMIPDVDVVSFSRTINTQLVAKPYLPLVLFAACMLALADTVGKTRSVHHVKLLCLYCFTGGLFTIASLDAGGLSFIQAGLKFLTGSNDNQMGATLPLWARFNLVPFLSMPLAAAAVILAFPHASEERTCVYAGLAMLSPLILGAVIKLLANKPDPPPSTVPTTGTTNNSSTISG